MPSENYLLGRQPILNRDQELVAYELLFRSKGALTAEVQDASHATANVIVNTLTGFGIENILGDHQGFINMELELLMDDSLYLLPKEQVVIELLETLEVTPALVERCRLLKSNGFTLALDDHEYSPVYHELYQIVDIVKVDLALTASERLPGMVEQLAPYPVQLLAEKVETHEEFRCCRDLGFHLFQGYYFARPSIMEKKRLGDSGPTLLKLLRLLSEDSELAEIEKTFRNDPVLTYKLLLLVNSVGVGTRNKIETVRHAISILGRQQIKRWVQLALFANNGQEIKENPLVDLAAVRAGFMENMAGCLPVSKGGYDAAEKAFMTGILSVLDQVYDIPIDEVLRNMNLSDDISEAIFNKQGGLGTLLTVAELVEDLNFGHLDGHLSAIGISLDNVFRSQKKAFAWRSAMA
jgi:c-di-GMP-related signal transduction protein